MQLNSGTLGNTCSEPKGSGKIKLRRGRGIKADITSECF
jgi:hypothetical protein